MTCVNNRYNSLTEKYSSYGSPDQSGMFSGCLTYNFSSMSQFYQRLIRNFSFSNTKVMDKTRPEMIPKPNAQGFACWNYPSRHICSTSHLEEKEYEPILPVLNPEVRRAVNRQPGYRAGTRRADAHMLKCTHVQYIFRLSGFLSKIEIFGFHEKCQNIFEN